MIDSVISILYVSLILIAFVATKIRLGRFIAINTLLTSSWVAVALCAEYADLGILRPRVDLHLQVIYGVVSFNLIYLVGAEREFRRRACRVSSAELFSPKRVYWIQAAGVLLLLPNLLASVSDLQASGFDLEAVRQATYIQQRFGTNWEKFAFRAIPIGLMNFVSVVAALNLARGSGRFMGWAALDVLLLGLTFGDRTAAFALLTYVFAAMLIIGRGARLRGRQVLVGLLMVASMIIVSAGRHVGLGSVLSSLSIYFAGGMSLLELAVREPSVFGFDQGMTWGYLTLGFILEPLVLLLKSLGLTEADVPSYYFNIYAQPFHDIGVYGVVPFNNNTTALYIFMRDFGVGGGVVGFGLLALMAVFHERRILRSRWPGWEVSYAFLFYVVLNSVMYYAALSTMWAMMMLCAWWAGRGGKAPAGGSSDATPLLTNPWKDPPSHQYRDLT